MKKEKGNIGDLCTTLFMVMAMIMVMSGFINSAKIISKKYEINNLARNYIIRMETQGYLTSGDERELIARLEALGITDISLAGTTRNEVEYGSTIDLRISGRVEGNYEFTQKKRSTTKH